MTQQNGEARAGSPEFTSAEPYTPSPFLVRKTGSAGIAAALRAIDHALGDEHQVYADPPDAKPARPNRANGYTIQNSRLMRKAKPHVVDDFELAA